MHRIPIKNSISFSSSSTHKSEAKVVVLFSRAAEVKKVVEILPHIPSVMGKWQPLLL